MTPVAVTIGPKPPATVERGHHPDLLALDAGEQYRFGFNMNACIGCHSCEVACAEQNGLPAGTVWRRVGELEGGDHPATKRFHLSMACNHCIEPACLQGCPTNAYEKLANGIVVHHAEDCIGCQYCTWNCPYSVPVFQPDRRIVTKCDLCQPRLEAGRAPACVDACPTQAITVEKVNVEQWRADHAAGDAPALPSAAITLSTTRIELPTAVPADTLAASDWSVRPEHPHWSLIWLTLLSQLAVGMTLFADSTGQRASYAAAAAAALAGALFHLGRPIMAYKALRNLRHSWLSREVVLLGLFGALAPLTVALPAAQPVAATVGVAGVLASAGLYVVGGRPAWNTPLTLVRFSATALVLGAAATGQRHVLAVALALAVAATALNWVRLRRRAEPAWSGSVHLELHWFRAHTAIRLVTALASVAGALAGTAPLVVFGLAALSELIGRYLFYVTVVPLNMPGAFWRGAGGSHR